MADFYDVNAAIAKPNILNSVREGIQYADATRDANTARAEAAHEKQLKQLRGAAQYMKQALQTGNPAAVSGAWQAVRPFLSQAGGQEPPPEWTPDMEAKMEQALAQTAYLGQSALAGAPSGLREFQAMTQGLSPDDVTKARRINLGLEGRASSSGFTQIKFTGPDGRERVGSFNGRTGQFDMPDGTSFNPQTGLISATEQSPAGTQGNPLPPGGTQPVVDQIMASANQLIARGVPEGQVDAWVQQQMPQGGAQQAPQTAQPVPQQPQGGALPPRLDYQGGGQVNPFVGRAPEDQAAATTAAQEGAKLQFLPQELDMRTQAGIDQAAGIAAAEDAAKRASKEVERQMEGADILGLLDAAEVLIPASTASGLGSLADAAASFFGVTLDGAAATQALKALSGQLVSKQPRMEGPQSDHDRDMYAEMAGQVSAAIPAEQRLAAIAMIRALNQKYAEGNRTGTVEVPAQAMGAGIASPEQQVEGMIDRATDSPAANGESDYRSLWEDR